MNERVENSTSKKVAPTTPTKEWIGHKEACAAVQGRKDRTTLKHLSSLRDESIIYLFFTVQLPGEAGILFRPGLWCWPKMQSSRTGIDQGSRDMSRLREEDMIVG